MDKFDLPVIGVSINRSSVRPLTFTKSGCLIVLLFSIGSSFLAGCNYPSSESSAPASQIPDLQLTLDAMDAEKPQTPPLAEITPTQTQASSADPFAGLQTPTPVDSPDTLTYPLPTAGPLPPVFDYITLSGDSPTGISARFEVDLDEITSSAILPSEGYLQPGIPLRIPNHLKGYSYPDALLPDSEVIFSPTAEDFDIAPFVAQAGGFLDGYSESVDGELLTGSEIIKRVALERSSNPRLLLAFLELRSHWVSDQPPDPSETRYPIGFNAPGYSGLYDELTLTANHLNIGFYNWRTGDLNQLRFKDGRTARLSPLINAGTAAIYNLFAKFYDQAGWEAALFGEDDFPGLYFQLFGDPWERASGIEPLLHPGVRQPELELPFPAGERWSFTGGPHRTLNLGSPFGALDFSPVTGQSACAVSRAWVTAPAGGLVTRTGDGILVLDLDGDGSEATGWVLFFLHIAAQGRVSAGTLIETDDPLGHPSCEGGSATGTHVHLARKYNGEWIAADGPVPFVLSGWTAKMGNRAYEGELVKDGQNVYANPGGSQTSLILR
jgi:LasA protease